jgi:hypothetical protein
MAATRRVMDSSPVYKARAKKTGLQGPVCLIQKVTIRTAKGAIF